MNHKRQIKYFAMSNIYVGVLLVTAFLGVDEATHGMLAIICSVVFLMNLWADKLLFTPFLFANIYISFFGFYELKLRLGMTDMDRFSKCVILFGMLIWLEITSLNGAVYFSNKKIEMRYAFNLRKFKQTIYLLSIISVSMMLYEWYCAGGIPVMQKDVETFRMNVAQSGITHTLAVMIKVLAVLVITYWLSSPKSRKKEKGLSFVVILAILLMYGTGNRGELLFIPVVSFLIYSILYRPSKRILLFSGIAVAFVVAGLPIIRGWGMYGSSYFTIYANISKYPQYSILLPLYEAVAYNFEILNKLFNTFPEIVGWGLGHFTFFVYIPFVGSGYTLTELQNVVWHNNFYGGLTSTYLGTWYADFGYVGCLLGTIILCVFCNFLYSQLVRKREYYSLVLYSYTYYMVLLGTYSNAFNFVFICYVFLIWFVMKTTTYKVPKK